MNLKLNLQRQVLKNMNDIAGLKTTATGIESDIDSISQRVANTETDILDLSLRTLKRSVLPLASPQIISLGTDGTQVNLTLGTNLSISNGVLNAAGGGDLSNYVQKTDYASYSTGGTVRVYPSGYNQGINISQSGLIYVQAAAADQIKKSSTTFNPIVTSTTHLGTFYGLSRAAGVNLASSTKETAPDGTNTGVYPAAAKQAICNLIGAQSIVEVVRLI